MCHRYGHYKYKFPTNLNNNDGRKSNFVKKKDEMSLLMAYNMNEKNHQNL
jgi:hypothetical protein